MSDGKDSIATLKSIKTLSPNPLEDLDCLCDPLNQEAQEVHLPLECQALLDLLSLPLSLGCRKMSLPSVLVGLAVLFHQQHPSENIDYL